MSAMRNISRRWHRSVLYLMLSDYAIMVATFGLALRLRHYNRGMDIIDLSEFHIIPQAVFAFLYAAVMIYVFSAMKLYMRKTWFSRPLHFLSTLQSALIVIIGYLLTKTLFKSDYFVPSRLVIMNWGFMLFSALLLHRIIVFPRLMRWASRAGMARRIVIIGDSKAGADFLRQAQNEEKIQHLVAIGLLSNRMHPQFVTQVPQLGKIDELRELVAPHKIEGAVITASDLEYNELMELIEECVALFGWVDVRSPQSAVLHENLETDTYFDIPFVRMGSVPNNPKNIIFKRVEDLLLASVGLVLLSPLLLAVAIAIKLTSKGPALYTRERVGMNGKPFRFYKFRSMYVGADQDAKRNDEIRKYIQSNDGQMASKIVNPAQITPIGRFIRKWAIDELPQLFNVIKGEMSMVGPRPVPLSEYRINDEWQKKRFSIKPGCTGLWKVQAAKNTSSTFNHSVLYDIYYARNMSPLMDVYAIFRTIIVILSGKADG